MARVKNQRIFSLDRDYLLRLEDEYRNYVGRYCELDLKNGVLTVFSRVPTKPKKKEKTERNKRSEKFERRA